MNSINMAEILIVNNIGIFLMVFLRMTRIENVEKRFVGDKIFDIMTWITIAGCTAEILTFVIDGKVFAGCRMLSYLLNSFCFIGTCSVGFLWCLYVDFRIFHNVQRMRKRGMLLAIPLAIDILMILINFSGCGIVFTISEQNVYTRGSLVLTAYIILFFYFIYSIFLVDYSKKSGLHIKFFPAYYFVVPCMLGTIIQGMFYGITIGWTSVAVAFLFVYIQTQSQNSFVDTLSGLYNRRYMDYILSRFKKNPNPQVYGIMIDVNNFKKINDLYGHSIGDDAIRRIGQILSEAVPDNGIAIRYAGDEFIIFLRTGEEDAAVKVMGEIEKNVEQYNRSSEGPYSLSLAMGCSSLDLASGSIEAFLAAMDGKMYEAKRNHYRQEGVDRRKKDRR